ncbi:uncharacterized protein TNCV_1417491 [Trichonephila clavipes]|nr:uncharacterized protein TNCV_1417491 [Trichonephila clavipes]
MNGTTQLVSRNETTQPGSRNETTQLCTAVDRLHSRIGFFYLLSSLKSSRVVGGRGREWYWARTYDKASHSPIPIPLGYRGHVRATEEEWFLCASGHKGEERDVGMGCMKANLIASRYECPRCKKEMRLQERKGTIDGYEWRCRSQSKDNPHDVVRSVRKGTWFSESKFAITIILRLTRYWFGKSMNAFVVNDDLTVTTAESQDLSRDWWKALDHLQVFSLKTGVEPSQIKQALDHLQVFSLKTGAEPSQIKQALDHFQVFSL